LALDEGASPKKILAPAFISAVYRGFASGLPQRYRRIENKLTKVRRSVDVAEQLRLRDDAPLAIVFHYDDSRKMCWPTGHSTPMRGGSLDRF